MVCVTVAEKSVEACLRALEGLSFAEIRIDAMDVKPDDLQPIFSCGKTLVATCRPGRFSDDERLRLLLASIDAGASFVDVEVDSAREYRAVVIEKARSRDCRVIVSFHDYEKTPERTDLLRIVAPLFRTRSRYSEDRVPCELGKRRGPTPQPSRFREPGHRYRHGPSRGHHKGDRALSRESFHLRSHRKRQGSGGRAA